MEVQTTAISFHSVDFSYNHEPLFDDLSLTIKLGESIALVGPSGCGKTTICGLASGFFEPSSGSISILQRDPKRAAKEGQIGYVFQQSTLLPWLTVWENTAFPIRLAGHSQVKVLVDAALDKARITEAAGKYPHELSGGMKARANIARALAISPQVLLLDETFSSLDDGLRESLYRDLQDLWIAENTTCVLVTHNINEALRLSDRIFVLGRNGGGFSIKDIIAVQGPKKRDLATISSPEFLSLKTRILQHLGVEQ